MPIIIKNDELNLASVSNLRFDNIVISPGPGRPDVPKDFGICRDVIKFFKTTPILGVCLGHQGLAFLAGSKIVHAPRVRHGKYSRILHNGKSLFEGIPNAFNAVRYHSLVIAPESVPPEIEILAHSQDDNQIMAIGHRRYPHFGVQFHPESIGTEYGEQLLGNFLKVKPQILQPVALPRSRKRTHRIYFKETAWKSPEIIFQSLLADAPYAFWMDSSSGGEKNRYSYMGTAARVIEVHGRDVIFRHTNNTAVRWSKDVRTGNPYDLLQEELDKIRIEDSALPVPFKGGLTGYFSYEFGTSQSDLTGKTQLPESLLFQCLNFIAFDHLLKKIWVCALYQSQPASAQTWVSGTLRSIALANAPVEVEPEDLPFEQEEELKDILHGFNSSRSRAQYLSDIGQIKGLIREGETYEVCLTNEFVKEVNVPPGLIYSTLRKINPAPYSCYLRFPQGAVLSSSPERFLQVSREGEVFTEPIKGTRPRGLTMEEDIRLREDLISNRKDASELLMITDLLRNDLAKVCEPGSITVKDLKKISEFATVLQLSSVISGRLRPRFNLMSLLQACFPGGSITGAPKKRTMEIISRFERRRRGVYTGCMGYLGYDNTLSLNIAIRTIVMEKNRLTIGSGGAITAQSDPDMEYKETLVKAAAMVKAVKFAEMLHSISGI